jgi:hypothetical protein
MSHDLKHIENEVPEQRLLRSLGKLESFVAFGDVCSIWLCPVLYSRPARWVLVYITSSMEMVDDFASLSRKNSKGLDLSPAEIRLRTVDELLGGRLLLWSAIDLVSDVLFLPSNWYEHGVSSYIEAIYGFQDEEYLRNLKTLKSKAIYVYGN